jgi:hypothetical protein
MKYARITGLIGALAATAVFVPAASAAPVVTQATGPDAAAIQGAVDQFRNDLGNNNAAGPPAASGRRQINWDGVPDARSAPSFMPENQFRNLGALFSTPGLGFEVSGDDDNDGGNPDADPDLVNFSDLNATYTAAFAPFSPERLFAPIGSNVTNTTFVVPNTNTAADTNGFGAVFSDVDEAGPTKLELLAADGHSLGTWTVPATAGSGTFSFLGVRLDAGERAALARITTGAAPLGNPDVTQSGPADVAVMDDFIYGEPKAIPPAQPPVVDTEAPQVKVQGAKRRIELGRLLRGLELTLIPNEAASYEVTLTGSARSVELSKSNVVLAERTLGLAAGERELRLRPARKLLRQAPSRFGVQLVVEATDRAGNSATVSKSIKVTH